MHQFIYLFQPHCRHIKYLTPLRSKKTKNLSNVMTLGREVQIFWLLHHSAHTKVKAVLMRWMKLESIIQSEVSQKEKHQYSILTHIYEI